MQKIPLIDVRDDGLHRLVDDNASQIKSLIRASRSMHGVVSHAVSHFVLPNADRMSRSWLIKNCNPYLDEIDYVADKLKTAGVYALNICFEWGCTTSVYAQPTGLTLARVMDWAFPKLGENLIVTHQSGAAGSFFNVTWPGLSGMFQGMAPGRFAAAINQAPMQRHGLTLLGDWIVNRRHVFQGSGLPPAHVLRKVFEEAETYGEAKERLCRTPLALPVIYILSGTQYNEGCVIERTENDFAIRDLGKERVCASNQFDTRLNAIGYGWRPRPVKSLSRVEFARNLNLRSVNDNFDWFIPPIANAHSRLAMMANAANETLMVFGAHGPKRVTETFDLKRNVKASDLALSG